MKSQIWILTLVIASSTLLSACNYALDELGALPRSGTQRLLDEVGKNQEKIVDLDTAPLSFTVLRAEILDKKCMSCHSVEKAKDTVLETLEDMKLSDLIAEKAEDSILYQVCVPGMAKRFMSPKKSNIPALDEKELSYLKRWIDAGTPE